MDNFIEDLQGRVKFPTGGIVRERFRVLNRCNSDTDSIVWMEEGFAIIVDYFYVAQFFMPWVYTQGHFL